MKKINMFFINVFKSKCFGVGVLVFFMSFIFWGPELPSPKNKNGLRYSYIESSYTRDGYRVTPRTIVAATKYNKYVYRTTALDESNYIKFKEIVDSDKRFKIGWFNSCYDWQIYLNNECYIIMSVELDGVEVVEFGSSKSYLDKKMRAMDILIITYAPFCIGFVLVLISVILSARECNGYNK